MVGEANFSDHGANRLGASALMQGLADGYFILPYTIGDYWRRPSFRGGCQPCGLPGGDGECAKINRLLGIKGKRTVDSIHRELGRLLWDYCGMARNATASRMSCRRFPSCVRSSGITSRAWDQEEQSILEKAGRVADFLEFAELMCTMRSIATNPAGRISARNTKRPR